MKCERKKYSDTSVNGWFIRLPVCSDRPQVWQSTGTEWWRRCRSNRWWRVHSRAEPEKSTVSTISTWTLDVHRRTGENDEEMWKGAKLTTQKQVRGSAVQKVDCDIRFDWIRFGEMKLSTEIRNDRKKKKNVPPTRRIQQRRSTCSVERGENRNKVNR